MEMEVAYGNDDSPPGSDTRYGFPSAFDLFALFPRDLSRESTTVLDFAPIAPIRSDTPLEFNIMANSQRYIDLKNIRLYLRVQVKNSDGTNITEDDVRVGVTNYPIASLFQQADLYLQQQLVCSSGTGYAYKGIIDVLLENDKNEMDSELTESLFYRDRARSMDSKTNIGFTEREAFCRKSAIFELQGKLHLDLCRQERVLLNAVQFTLKLTPSRDSFRLFREPPATSGTSAPTTAAPTYKVEILNASLKVPMIKPTPAMLLGHAAGLQNGPALYPFERTEIKTFVIPSGQSSWPIENLFISRIPKRLVVAFVTSEAFSGNFSKNPFNFQHFKLSYLCLTVDGACVPSRAMQLDFSNDIYLEAYHTIFSLSEDEMPGRLRKTPSISRDDFANGYALFCFNIDDSTQGDEVLNPQAVGLSKMEIKFAESLKESVTVIMYAAYNSLLRVDESRNIKVDG